jgi:phosphatidylglycerophosphatase A
MNRPRVGLITVFGLGHMWPASGTWGSLPPVVLALGLWLVRPDNGDLHPFTPGSPTWWVAATTAVLVGVMLFFSAACVVQGDAAEARFGEKDPSEAVADETAGQCLPLIVLVWFQFNHTGAFAAGLFTAFLSFRLMDILKPPPARDLQRLYAGWGILIDDLLAGIYAAAATWVVLRFFVGPY